MIRRIACFIGWSNTGKTSFIADCASILTERGVRVAAVKCAHHGASFNLDGKDSTRFFEAGAETAVISDSEIVRVTRTPRDWDRSLVEALFPDDEVALIEGRIVDGAVRVLVGGPAEAEADLKRPLSGFDALVTDKGGLAAIAVGRGLSVFSPSEAAGFVDRLIGGGTMEDRKVSLTTGGVEVPLNPFVRELIESVALGLVRPLKKADLDGEIVIRIGPKE